jgi:hypothetical protein
MNDLEWEFEKLIQSAFETLRYDYRERRHSKEEAEKLQKMLEERLGVTDPLGPIPEEGWRRSNWCVGG